MVQAWTAVFPADGWSLSASASSESQALESAAIAPQRVRGAQQRGEELQEHRQLRRVAGAFRGDGAAELGQAIAQRP